MIEEVLQDYQCFRYILETSLEKKNKDFENFFKLKNEPKTTVYPAGTAGWQCLQDEGKQGKKIAMHFGTELDTCGMFWF